MILKRFDQDKIINKQICLFHGNNDGQKELILKNLKKQFSDNVQIYYEKDIINNSDIFYDEVYSKSFFEKEKLLIVKNVTDKFLKNIQYVIDRKIEETIIILISDILEKKSKLRSLFEKDINLISLAFYPDSDQTLISLINNFFKKKNISISFETINLLVNKVKGDRKSLINELEKIEMFLKNKGKITKNEIDKLTNINNSNDIGELIDNCLAKNKKKLLFLMNENNFNSEDLILIIRIFLSKSKRLLNLVKNFALHKDVDRTILESKPPIFWKEKEIIKKQIQLWSVEKVQKLIIEINQVEYLIKTNSHNSIHILSDFVLNKAK